VMRVLQDAQPLMDRNSERRRGDRFPIVREVRYKVTYRRGDPKSGIGTTVNVSSAGVLFTAPETLASGKRIELAISWPVQLDGKCPLKLVAQGRITRCQGTEVAMEIENHEFRTRSSGGLMPA